MKKFLIISLSLLAVALLLAVLVFWYVSVELSQSQSQNTTIGTESVQNTAATATTTAALKGVPLRNIPLGDSQKSVLETVGVDVETFVITPAMQSCATTKLGAERMGEIIAGAAPSALETAKLVPCLSAE